jgi:hypothetical protein
MAVNAQELLGKEQSMLTIRKHMPAGPFAPRSFVRELREVEK